VGSEGGGESAPRAEKVGMKLHIGGAGGPRKEIAVVEITVSCAESQRAPVALRPLRNAEEKAAGGFVVFWWFGKARGILNDGLVSVRVTVSLLVQPPRVFTRPVIHACE